MSLNDAQFRELSDANMASTDERELFAARLLKVERKLDTNTELTAKLGTDMATFLTIFDTFEAGFKVLGGLGKIARWAAPILTACAAIWAIMHGKFPKLGD
jgi:hypothetical protein